MLKVLDNIFYQKLTREAILPPADIKNIFTNLGDIVQLHGTCTHGHKRTHRHVYACTHTYTHRMTLLHSLSFWISVWISEQMVTIRKRNETSVIDQIGDDLLSWVSTALIFFILKPFPQWNMIYVIIVLLERSVSLALSQSTKAVPLPEIPFHCRINFHFLLLYGIAYLFNWLWTGG